MRTITLYRSTRPDGGVDVSPTVPNVPYTTIYRLIADDNMVLTDGTKTTKCVDAASTEGWTEIFDPDADMIEVLEAIL